MEPNFKKNMMNSNNHNNNNSNNNEEKNESIQRIEQAKEKTLEDLLNEWSDSDDERRERWRNALKKVDVENVQALKKLSADKGSWDKTILEFEDLNETRMLAVSLKSWKGGFVAVKKDIEIKDELVDPKKVPIPMEKDAPPFTSEEGWLDKTVGMVLQNLKKEDNEKDRVSPMALVRCSRGGKTRALREIGTALKKKQPDLCVIYITLNDYSSLLPWEQDDPTGALCRRIAFAARKDNNFVLSQRDQFKVFYKRSFSPERLNSWLNGRSCVLCIDELNNLEKLREKRNSQAKECALFLKNNFLSPTNRYLIFSSHVVTTTTQLSSFMESSSSREVIVRSLPIIPNVSVAAKNFDWSDLNAKQVLFYGCVPALVYEARLNRNKNSDAHLPSSKRKEAIAECKEERLISNNSVIELLRTFIDGDQDDVLMPLLQLMNTVENEKGLWIPFHMMSVLNSFSRYCSNSLKLVLLEIVKLFEKFKNAKKQSGDGWEALFAIVLLIRSATVLFHEKIFPLSTHSFQGSDVCYNAFLNLEGKNFENICQVEDLVSRMETPNKVPCIVVYYPTHNSFEMYDVIVATYDSKKIRTLYGYQLKEGKEIPKVIANFSHSFVIRGLAAQSPNKLREWYIPNEEEINTFFGESGKMWTPKKWKELDNSTKSD